MSSTSFIHDTTDLPDNYKSLWQRANHACLSDAMEEATVGLTVFDRLHVFSSVSIMSFVKDNEQLTNLSSSDSNSVKRTRVGQNIED